MSMELFTTVNAFDHLMKDTMDALTILPRVVKAYVQTLEGYEECRSKWKQAIDECSTLSTQLTTAHSEISNLRSQIHSVRKLIDEEKKKRKIAEDDRDYYEAQLEQLRDILKDNRNELHEETKVKLSLLNKNRPSMDILEDRLNTITELETTGSVMTDLSYTRDEDDFLDVSSSENRGQKRSNPVRSNKNRKKRRSSSAVRACELKGKDRLVATTTVTVDHESKIQATAVIEARPHNENLRPSAPPMEDDGDGILTPKSNGQPFSMNMINTRPHNFQQKAMLKSETCNVCSKRLRFSAMGLKCRDCKTICHIICKDKVPLPCVANGHTPCKSSAGTIGDYTPLLPPMVPALVVHCIKEVEERGLSEVGLYRIPGSDKEVKALKEKFLRGKGVPNLSQIQEIHVVCGCLKDFFRSLKDPLTTRLRWDDFAQAVEIEDVEERRQKLFHIISSLPQPNRDTLAYLLLHLQRVAESPECKMPTSNLAKVFGPTVIGYSCNEPENVYGETRTGNKIMGELLELPGEYWESFIREADFRKTPSSSSIGFFSPNRVRPILKLTILKDEDPEEDQIL
ncbi:rac GTPase-activating protein 1 isoform X1 [Halyomorpha halys]|uniref:rac GTPase-activating protein 1 isoform X1 n=1 Tax=Halyomorpha halys TaxID=286706 RepID=UPI0006D4E4B3|nr:rac GTPase-activating protein 1-like isoform X1 [Halyomorpha halys]